MRQTKKGEPPPTTRFNAKNIPAFLCCLCAANLPKLVLQIAQNRRTHVFFSWIQELTLTKPTTRPDWQKHKHYPEAAAEETLPDTHTHIQNATQKERKGIIRRKISKNTSGRAQGWGWTEIGGNCKETEKKGRKRSHADCSWCRACNWGYDCTNTIANSWLHLLCCQPVHTFRMLVVKTAHISACSLCHLAMRWLHHHAPPVTHYDQEICLHSCSVYRIAPSKGISSKHT